MKKLVKIPQLISHEALKAGDIVIVSQNPRSSFTGKLIFAFQSLFNEEGGKNNAEHAAIIIEQDGQLKMAHLLGKGFVIDDTTKYHRTQQVYRIKDQVEREAIGLALSEFIRGREENLKKTVSWRFFVAFLGFFYHLFSSIGLNHTKLEDEPRVERPEKVSSHSVCTKFVAECMQIAADRADKSKNLRQKYMNLYTSTAPKNLQSYLQCNLHYSSFIMPQDTGLYSSVKDQLSGGLKEAAQAAMLSAIAKFETQNPLKDDFKKTCYLVKAVFPLLKSHPKHFEIWQFLNSQGVHQEYIDKDLLEESDENIQQHLIDYSPTEKQQYQIYRGRGYSDTYAQFKVRPTLGAWFALNPRRITFVSVVLPVIGILAVLIFGAVVLALIKKQNKTFEDKQTPVGSTPAEGREIQRVSSPKAPATGGGLAFFPAEEKEDTLSTHPFYNVVNLSEIFS